MIVSTNTRTDRARAGLGLTPISRTRTGRRASDLVFEELQSAIRDLRLEPGLQLSESVLTDEFSVSRTPVREALTRLAEAGLVNVVPQVGTQVSRIKVTDIVQAQFVRENLECGAFETACAQENLRTDALRDLLEEQKDAYRSEDEELFFAADEAMHRAIFTMAGYPGAWDVVQGTKLHMDRLRRLTLPEHRTTEELIDEHTRIVDALDARDLAGGRQLIQTHSRRALIHLPRLRDEHPHYFSD
ncbi:GntR family transcriptional regulator [Rhodococcus sp. NPDC055112]